jgi:hypothetical protein
MKKHIAVVLMCLVAGAILAACNPSQPGRDQPATLYVKPDSTGNCRNWNHACDLQTALEAAQPGDEIWVAAGIHRPAGTNAYEILFTLRNGVALYGGFAGTETAREQRDWVSNVTVLSGDLAGDDLTDPDGVVTDPENIHGRNARNVLFSKGVTETARIDGFVVTAGNGVQWVGGGMYNSQSSPTVANVIFSGNQAQSGGGMFNSESNPTLMNVTFAANNAEFGGRINDARSNPTLTNVTFFGNTADFGGGMCNWSSDPALKNVTFRANSATVFGGGMHNSGGGDPSLINVTFHANSAEKMGGGMYNENSNPTLINATFAANTATHGGGMLNFESSPKLVNVTLGANAAQVGGGSNAVNSNSKLTNTIVWGNIGADEHAQISNNPDSRPTIAHSDIQGCHGSGARWDSALGDDGGGNIDADPLFVDAASSCILHCDLRLHPNSPAVDGGDNSAIPPDIATDLDDAPRIVGDRVDMGAYEAEQ